MFLDIYVFAEIHICHHICHVHHPLILDGYIFPETNYTDYNLVVPTGAKGMHIDFHDHTYTRNFPFPFKLGSLTKSELYTLYIYRYTLLYYA